MREAARRAEDLDPGLVILEGSGAAVPPVPWDAGVLVAPADLPEEFLPRRSDQGGLEPADHQGLPGQTGQDRPRSAESISR